MLRVLVAISVVLGLTSAARAGRYKVYIESDPAGAAVYFDSTENTPVCKATPCTVDQPTVETIVYIQLENYTPGIESIDPAKKGQKISVKLTPAVGTLNVKFPEGSRVQINEEDKGKAPDKFELAEAGYHVVITSKGGKTLYDEFVEIKAGEETEIMDKGDDGTTKETPDPEKPDPDGSIGKSTPDKPHDRYIQASLVADIGFRKFAYENNKTTDQLLDETEGGQVVLGPMIEIWPTEILGLGKLRGLSIMAHYGRNVNPQAVTQKGAATTLTTFWQSIEVMIRHRWTIAPGSGTPFHVQVDGGYSNESYRFEGDTNQIMLVPDALYQSVRIGARAGVVLAGKIEPYLAVENRIVLSGGALETRWTRGADASGLHAALGATGHFGPIVAKFEGAITRYSWTFNSQPGDKLVATGGTDRIMQIMFGVGYAY